MKAIGYVRVSTGSQSNQRQIDEIKTYCKNKNIDEPLIFEEVGSGRIRVRPVLTEMEKYISDHPDEIDFVIISELSRLGRTSKVLETIENLHKNQIGLVALKEVLETLLPDKTINHSSGLIISILNGINAYELETTKYRSKSGIERSMKAGNANGTLNLPYGYTKEGKKLVVDEGEAETIKQIFKMYLAGNGTQKISNELNAIGTQTRTQKIKDYLILNPPSVDEEIERSEYNKFGTKWVDGTIYSILKNPIYIGERRRKTGYETIVKNDKKIQRPVYELMLQPQLKIIEHGVFESVQKLLKSNYNKADKHNVFEYLLEPQKILCGCCQNEKGIIRHYFPHKRQSGKDNRYICLSRRYKEPCSNVGMNIDKIEYTIQQIILFLYEDKLLERLDDKTMNKQIDVMAEEIASLRKELEKTNNAKLNIVRKEINGEINRNDYLKLLNEFNSQEKQIEQKLDIKLETKYQLNETYTNMKDIKQLKLKFKNGVKIPKDVVNKIISKIIITKQDIYPTDIFKKDGDKVVELKINSADQERRFLISQRERIIYYCVNDTEGFILNKFLLNKDNDLEKYQNKIYNKNLFNFFTANFDE